MKNKIIITEEYKTFLKEFILLFLPLVLQNMITLSVNLADNVMLGRYSEAALAGVTAVNQIQFIYQQILVGVGDGLVIIAAQYWGKRQTGKIMAVSSAAMRFSVVVMAAFFCILSVFPEELTRLFSPDRAIIAEGVAYLSIVKYTYLIFGFTSVLLATLRSMKIVSIALVLSTAAFAINVFLNWILIYGNLGASAMGAKGAAIATLIARVAELIILLFYIIKKGGLLKVSLKSFFHINKDISKDYFRICLPVIFMQSLWGLNNAVQTAILGQTSSAAITANSMASNLFLLVKIGAVGAASAANVMIGHAIGMGNIPEVKKDAKRFQIIFLVIGLLSTLILFVLIEPILSLYSFSRESADLSRQFLYILCFVIFGMSYQMPVNAGIIKGSGDMKYFVKLDLISIWGIVIPVSFLLAFVAKAPPVVVVASLNADQIFKCLPAFIKVNYGSWIKKLTRDEA